MEEFWDLGTVKKAEEAELLRGEKKAGRSGGTLRTEGNHGHVSGKGTEPVKMESRSKKGFTGKNCG